MLFTLFMEWGKKIGFKAGNDILGGTETVVFFVDFSDDFMSLGFGKHTF